MGFSLRYFRWMLDELLFGAVDTFNADCGEWRIRRSGIETEVGTSETVNSLFDDRLPSDNCSISIFGRLGDATSVAGEPSGGVPGLEVDLCSEGGRSFRLLELPEEPVVLLRTSFMGISVMRFSGVGGFLAWATASGPAKCGSSGIAMHPAIRLARTVTGSTFSFRRSFFFFSRPPNTMRCTRL